ncbi:hypothetical protein [Photorhabdus luminescens]|uniref:Uncharacterized protein n=1 Tax=Photorhabdus luminescens subsp. mexicana TaxID=2100167 RepID=A0A4R4JBM7_PHOLU|nr:hypothetical protein [Photorhabdus luminescens]TDB51417.1 hypothetical protein C5468_12515 [Photorhabdus luminescens subsp. mexicana]
MLDNKFGRTERCALIDGCGYLSSFLKSTNSVKGKSIEKRKYQIKILIFDRQNVLRKKNTLLCSGVWFLIITGVTFLLKELPLSDRVTKDDGSKLAPFSAGVTRLFDHSVIQFGLIAFSSRSNPWM